jgi:hypothetical protein
MKQNCSVTVKILEIKFEFSFVLLTTKGMGKFPPHIHALNNKLTGHDVNSGRIKRSL